MTTRAIRTITLYPDVISIEYVEPEVDLAANGLVLNHVITIPVTSDREEEITALVNAGLDLLDDALEDHRSTPKLGEVALGEDEDETSPYDNPGEREGAES